jgi:hypothetical protein
MKERITKKKGGSKMNKVKYKIYSCDELSNEAKDKIIQNFSISDADTINDILKEGFGCILEEKYPYFKEPSFIWDLNHSQGDGLSFSSSIDLKLFIEKELPDLSHKDAYTELVFSIITKYNQGHYCYASRRDIEFEYNHTFKEFILIEKTFEYKILPMIENKYLEACKELEEAGYLAYEYIDWI